MEKQQKQIDELEEENMSVEDVAIETKPVIRKKTTTIFLNLSAPPRFGKSTWVQNCLCKRGKVYDKKKIDLVYVVSPSLKTAKDDPFECLPNDQIEQVTNPTDLANQ